MILTKKQRGRKVTGKSGEMLQTNFRIEYKREIERGIGTWRQYHTHTSLYIFYIYM